jgi:hypothetical protein
MADPILKSSLKTELNTIYCEFFGAINAKAIIGVAKAIVGMVKPIVGMA